MKSEERAVSANTKKVKKEMQILDIDRCKKLLLARKELSKAGISASDIDQMLPLTKEDSTDTEAGH